MSDDTLCSTCGAYWKCDCAPAPEPMKPLPSWLSDALQPGSHEQGVTYTAGDYESMKQYMTNTEAARFVWGGGNG